MADLKKDNPCFYNSIKHLSLLVFVLSSFPWEQKQIPVSGVWEKFNPCRSYKGRREVLWRGAVVKESFRSIIYMQESSTFISAVLDSLVDLYM